MDRAELLAQAARGFLGTPFKLHGRERETGLDCVGLVIACLGEIGVRTEGPAGYSLRNLNVERWLGFARRAGLDRHSQVLSPVLFNRRNSISPPVSSRLPNTRAGSTRVLLRTSTSPGLRYRVISRNTRSSISPFSR